MLVCVHKALERRWNEICRWLHNGYDIHCVLRTRRIPDTQYLQPLWNHGFNTNTKYCRLKTIQRWCSDLKIQYVNVNTWVHARGVHPGVHAWRCCASPKLSRDKGSAEKPGDPPTVREINFGLWEVSDFLDWYGWPSLMFLFKSTVSWPRILTSSQSISRVGFGLLFPDCGFCFSFGVAVSSPEP